MKEGIARLRAIRTRDEDAFTLIEVLIVIVVIGLITSIAVPLGMKAQREAHISSIKSDVSANVRAAMPAPATTGRLYATPEQFASKQVLTEGNVVGYYVNESGNRACVEVWRRFSPGDVVGFYLDTQVGKPTAGICPEFGAGAATPEPEPEPEEEITPDPELGGGGPVGDSGEVSQMAGLIFDITYQPQQNLLTFCYRIRISLDMSHELNKPAAGSFAWRYVVDLSQAPFHSLNPHTDLNSEFGFTTQEVSANLWVITGEGWNDIVSGSTGAREVGFCTTSVPLPAINASLYTVEIEAKQGNSNWWACVVVKVVSSSPYPVPWQAQVNLDNYFRSLGSTAPQFTNLTNSKVAGNTYLLSGVAGNNLLVSASWPRTSTSETICYNPNGAAW